ncbi:hypothetical protein F3087_40275 [Nocardia colli]|uniref:Uncharacterized protein n=1 Tax=Nocardia colli TaxID=2545717 RepID=A0A5N0E105_9NOCA|nr:hypothetical protein [Nocardia colli]KAA8881905.1 hypothetical protein F3087_40275 [Nocardia colli]
MVAVESPYWHRIVGEHWPAVDPALWRELETIVRAGVAAGPADEIAQARRAFENAARASAGLSAADAEMRAQSVTSAAFTDALGAAADTFRDIAELVYRTRNKILDIVDHATAGIRIAERPSDEDDRETTDATAVRERIDCLVAEARAAVEDVTSSAMNSIDPSGLPSLARVAELLGAQSPWRISKHGSVAPDGPVESAPRAPVNQPGAARVIPVGDSADLSARDASSMRATPDMASETVAGARFSMPDTADVAAGTQHSAGDGGTTDPGAPGRAVVASDETEPAPDVPVHAGAVARVAPAQLHQPDPSPDVLAERPSAVTDSATTELAATTDSATMDSVTTGPTTAGLVTANPVTAGAMILPPTMSVPPPGAVVAAGFAAPHAAQPATVPQVSGPQPASRADNVRAAAGAEPAASIAVPEHVKTPVSAQARPDDRRTGTDELLGAVVGAALAAVAAPAFMVGEHVDADLVLVQSLLSGTLAATNAALPVAAWAVAAMRHAGGLTVFITSNEGRGYLPAGLFLPRELSTPWDGNLPGDEAWEDIDDPARVLAEFGAVWAARSGATMTALASSSPIAPRLAHALPELPMAGSVVARSELDLSAPGPGLVDRLALVGSPEVNDRIAAVPANEIAGRCLRLAEDAHARLGTAAADLAADFGVRALRERILAARQRGRGIAEHWLRELADADDLIAASMRAWRVDASNTELGRLQPRGRADPEATALRRMVFERRCDELVLLAAGPGERQDLRDSIYAYAQITEHPLFTASIRPGPGHERPG